MNLKSALTIITAITGLTLHGQGAITVFSYPIFTLEAHQDSSGTPTGLYCPNLSRQNLLPIARELLVTFAKYTDNFHEPMTVFDYNACKIAAYLRSQKERKLQEAKDMYEHVIALALSVELLREEHTYRDPNHIPSTSKQSLLDFVAASIPDKE